MPSENDHRDEDLRNLMHEGIIKPYVVIEKENMRFGFMGLIGKDAIDVIRNHAPVTFLDAIKTAQKIAHILRTQEKADVIIALSHSGITRTTSDDAGNWIGEDVDLARAVLEIDIIISGHTHLPLKEPIYGNLTFLVMPSNC